MLCLSAVTDEDCHSLENDDESGRRLCEYWGRLEQHLVQAKYVRATHFTKRTTRGKLMWESCKSVTSHTGFVRFNLQVVAFYFCVFAFFLH